MPLKERFNAKLDEIYEKKNSNSFLVNDEKYNLLVNRIEEVSKNGAKMRTDFDIRKNYEIHVINDVMRIFRSDTQELVRTSVIFDILTKVKTGYL